MLVALVLFALIGTAGFSVLDQVIRVQARTDGRLERLAEMQRAMHLVTLDFMQASGGSLSFADGAVSFRRGAGVGEIAVRYGLEDTALVRSVSGSLGAAPAGQALAVGRQRDPLGLSDARDRLVGDLASEPAQTVPPIPRRFRST